MFIDNELNQNRQNEILKPFLELPKKLNQERKDDKKNNSNLIASIAYNELTKEDERIYHELIGHQMTTEEKKLLMLGGGWI